MDTSGIVIQTGCHDCCWSKQSLVEMVHISGYASVLIVHIPAWYTAPSCVLKSAFLCWWYFIHASVLVTKQFLSCFIHWTQWTDFIIQDDYHPFHSLEKTTINIQMQPDAEMFQWSLHRLVMSAMLTSCPSLCKLMWCHNQSVHGILVVNVILAPTVAHIAFILYSLKFLPMTTTSVSAVCASIFFNPCSNIWPISLVSASSWLQFGITRLLWPTNTIDWPKVPVTYLEFWLDLTPFSAHPYLSSPSLSSIHPYLSSSLPLSSLIVNHQIHHQLVIA